MDMKDMQTEVDDWIAQFEEGYWHPLSMMARLTEEVGELSREINHTFGEKPKKNSEETGNIEMELGDILFVIVSFANSLDIDLEKAFGMVMKKYRQRDTMRWTHKKEDGKE